MIFKKKKNPDNENIHEQWEKYINFLQLLRADTDQTEDIKKKRKMYFSALIKASWGKKKKSFSDALMKKIYNHDNLFWSSVWEQKDALKLRSV